MKYLSAMILSLVLLGLSPAAWATNYYISPTGNDTLNNGLSSAAPWLTFAKAMGASGVGAGTPCGHTLIVMDGTYTTTINGSLQITDKDCTVGSPFLVQAQTQRAALLQGNGTNAAGQIIRIYSSNYITIDGLRVKSIDNVAATSAWVNILVSGSSGGLTNPSDHVTLKNLIVSHNNRTGTPAASGNTALIRFAGATNGLIEDTELYSYHRHGAVFSGDVSNSVMRRIYCNSRAYADIAGGYVSSPTTKGDSCVANYTSGGTFQASSNTFENIISEGNGTGFDIEAVSGPIDDKFYGDISLNDLIGMQLRARGGSTESQQPVNTVVKDFVAIGPTTYGIASRGAKNTVITNATIYDGIGSNQGIAANIENCTINPCFDGGGTVSIYGYNILSTLNPTGYTITTSSSFADGIVDDWVMDHVDAYLNTTNYSPSSHANYNNPDTPATTDPALGTCRVYRPTGSAALTNNWGADILYRYQNGGITTTPLWDPTSGEFPHGAIISGVNDIAGSSLFDVHQRLNVNYNGCNFPDSFADATNPENPTGYVSSVGTTSPHSHTHTVDAGMDSLTVGVALRDVEGNVGSVTSVTACGGEALSLLKGQTSSPAYYRSELWGKINPTAGVCTITVTTTGAVDGIVSISIETDNISAYDDVAGASVGTASSTPTVTVPTGTNETLIDMLAARCNYDTGTALCTTSLTAGPVGGNQTLQKDVPHTTVANDLRGATSVKSGTNGGIIDYSMGNPNYWSLTAVALCPTAGCASAPTQALGQVAGQVDSAFLVSGAVVHLGAVNAASVSIDNGTSFAVALQTDCTVADCAAGGRKLYVSYNGGAYAAVTDSAVNHLSFFGATSDPTVVSGAISTNLSGVLTNVPGTTIHSVNVNPLSDMTQDDSLVNRWVLKLAPTAVATDTYEFREYTDAGVALDAYGATADAKITVTGSVPVITAPTNLHLAGSTSTNTSLLWSPVTYATFSGYHVYQGTSAGVYDATLTQTITPASAAATHTPLTTYHLRLPTAATYYFIVKAFDLDGNESAATSEVSVAMMGQVARTVRTP